MQSCEKFIQDNNLLKRGEVIGVGCSGGSDSLALLHYLATNQERFDIEVVAVHVDHQIRETSGEDVEFVREKARELGVRFYKFRVDVPKLAKEKSLSIETAGREARRGVFKALIDKGIVDKIALAHQMTDQVESILMHIFRGAGLSGVRGMEAESGFYIRPLLNTSKQEIYDYLARNGLEFLEDETNRDNTYTRNYLRNVVMKDICARWPNAQEAILNFSKSIKEDDDYINAQIADEILLNEGKLVKIPLSYFIYPDALTSRLIFKAFKSIGVNCDIERKHINLILNLAKNGNNGNKLSLPYNISASREYDYLTLYNAEKKEKVGFEVPFKAGSFDVENFGRVSVKKMKDFDVVDTWVAENGELYIDYNKLPKGAVWRFREEGDNFTKFGGKSKKLKSYMIDKKIPVRLRNFIPVLAVDKEVYVIAGVEVSDKVKVEKGSNIYQIATKNTGKLF